MTRNLAKTIACCFTFSVGLVAYSFSDAGVAESKARELTAKLHKAEKTCDESQLRSVFAETVLYRHSRGSSYRFSNEEIVKQIREFEGKIVDISTFLMSASASNDRVVVGFWLNMTVRIGENDELLTHSARYEYEFRRQFGEWKLSEIRVWN